jgi:putative redox protein
VAPKPPTIVDLVWTERLEFAATFSNTSLVIDSGGTAGPSPVELLCGALAGCISVDVAHILHRGRHCMTALSSRLTAERAPENPHRITAVTIHFEIGGDVPRAAIERAIHLSHEKYCSVWHSLRQDIELRVTFDLEP